MTNYFKKAVLGTSYVFAFSLLAMLFAYGFRLILARSLSTEEFGLFYAIIALLSFVHTFHDPGLKSALIKIIPEFIMKKQTEKMSQAISQTFIIWFSLSAIYSFIIIIFSDYLANDYFRYPSAAPLIILLAIAFVIQAIDYLMSYIFQGFQRMGLFASVDFLRTFMFFTVSLVGFYFFPGSIIIPGIAYIAGTTLLSAVYFPIFKLKVFREFRFRLGFDREILSKMMRFGIPVTIAGMSYSAFQQSGILILTYFGTLTEVGLLNIALPTSSLLISLSASVAYVIFPLASELWAQGFKDHLREGMKLLYKYAFIVILPLSLVMIAFAPLIIGLLFGEKYLSAAPALVVLSIGTIFWIIANINFNFLAGIGKSSESMKVILGMTLASIALNAVLIPFFGLMGAVWSIVAGYLFALLSSIAIMRRHLKVDVPLAFWLKTFFVGLLFLGTIQLLKSLLVINNQYLEAIVVLTLAGVVYCSALFLMRIISWDELRTSVIRVRE